MTTRRESRTALRFSRSASRFNRPSKESKKSKPEPAARRLAGLDEPKADFLMFTQRSGRLRGTAFVALRCAALR